MSASDKQQIEQPAPRPPRQPDRDLLMYREESYQSKKRRVAREERRRKRSG